MRLNRARRDAAFTLVELAVVLMVVGLLLSTLTYTLAAQVDQRTREQTQRTLEQAREALIGFAITNGRLPCPASASACTRAAMAIPCSCRRCSPISNRATPQPGRGAVPFPTRCAT